MNPLELLISELGLDPVLTMNGLQDAGLVSDNCVTAGEVALVDCDGACAWVALHAESLLAGAASSSRI